MIFKILFEHKQKSPIRNLSGLIVKIRAWQFSTFAWQPATLSSTLNGFTSEFGMGSGGSHSLWSPSKLVSKLIKFVYGKSVSFSRYCLSFATPIKLIGCYMVKPHEQLVHVSYAHYWTSTPCLSTS